ncbi:MAG TPA: hypothetical protein VFJ58_08805 [Armatimonadota bacterium]|nr:hypothetical protein [Armatimonadota bacterium]
MNRRRCPACEGKGWTEILEVDQQVAPAKLYHLVCRRCGGSGEIHHSIRRSLARLLQRRSIKRGNSGVKNDGVRPVHAQPCDETT